MLQAPRGTKDIYSPEIIKWQHIENKFKECAELYGYSEIRTPIFEDVNIFKRAVGETTDIVQKEMYVFKDKKDRTFALRPENTASIVRSYIQNKLVDNQYSTLPGGITRLFYIGPMFRYERPQSGRSRQFHQLGVELIGLDEPQADIEMISLIKDFFCSIKVYYQLELSSVGCELCRDKYRDELINYATKGKDSLCELCSERLKKNPLRILDCKVNGCKDFLNSSPEIIDYLCDKCRYHLDVVKSYVEKRKINFKINPRLVRGLDYYTRTVFEFKSDRLGSQDALAAGGRYNNLIEQFKGEPTPSVGFAAGIERLVLASQINEEIQSRISIYISHIDEECFEYVCDLSEELRQSCIKKGLALRVVQEIRKEPLKISRILSVASKYKFHFVIFIGTKEMKDNKVSVKNLSSGEQINLDRAIWIDKLIEIIV
ncbi:MAG: histidine--tRNA ligase [Candidatus Hydrogenedentota bacterium]